MFFNPSIHRALPVLALLWVAAPAAVLAQGQTGNFCVRDFTPGAVCTANDVRIEALTVVSVVEDCLTGVVGETEVVFETLVSAAGSPNRFDIGLFLALDGNSARDGDSCFHEFLAPPLTATPTYGDRNMDTINDITDGPWWDGDTDGCGDIETNTQLFKTLPPYASPVSTTTAMVAPTSRSVPAGTTMPARSAMVSSTPFPAPTRNAAVVT